MLTDDDKQWLESNKLNLAGWSAFQLALLRSEHGSVLIQIARDSLIYHAGEFVLARDLADKVAESASNSQIYEQWNYQCAKEVHRVAGELSASDAQQFIFASGYAYLNLANMADEAERAVNEVVQALYN